MGLGSKISDGMGFKFTDKFSNIQYYTVHKPPGLQLINPLLSPSEKTIIIQLQRKHVIEKFF